MLSYYIFFLSNDVIFFCLLENSHFFPIIFLLSILISAFLVNILHHDSFSQITYRFVLTISFTFSVSPVISYLFLLTFPSLQPEQIKLHILITHNLFSAVRSAVGWTTIYKMSGEILKMFIHILLYPWRNK